MKNARNQKSGNRNGKSTGANADNSRESIGNGGSVRTDGTIESKSTGGISGGQSGTLNNNSDASRSVSGNTGIEITDGHYFTPRGTIERIPNGYFIGEDGRLRKRRQSNRDNTADGNQNRDRTETGETPESVAASFLLDKPLEVRGKRGRKPKVKEETSKLSLVTMLSTASVAIFSSIELITKHEHWALEKPEAQILAEALNDAIATLPAKYYDSIIAIIERWIPWINLIFVIGAIVIPRLEASGKRIEERNYQPHKTDNNGNAGTKDNTVGSWSSLGWNKR